MPMALASSKVNMADMVALGTDKTSGRESKQGNIQRRYAAAQKAKRDSIVKFEEQKNELQKRINKETDCKKKRKLIKQKMDLNRSLKKVSNSYGGQIQIHPDLLEDTLRN